LGDDIISLKIETTRGSWEHSFDKNTKIQDVIQEIINHFGFASNGNYELRMQSNPDEPLKKERPIVSYHLKDGDVLVFTDLGEAVGRRSENHITNR